MAHTPYIIFGEMLVRALCRNALELGAICCQPTSGPLVVPHSDVDETLGTLRYRTFAGISIWATGEPWQGMRTGGQI